VIVLALTTRCVFRRAICNRSSDVRSCCSPMCVQNSYRLLVPAPHSGFRCVRCSSRDPLCCALAGLIEGQLTRPPRSHGTAAAAALAGRSERAVSHDEKVQPASFFCFPVTVAAGGFWPTRAAKSWRSVKVTDFERRQMAAIRKELDEEYEFKCYPILLDSHRPRQRALGPSDRQRSGRSLL
jgi:hypothetical protein